MIIEHSLTHSIKVSITERNMIYWQSINIIYLTYNKDECIIKVIACLVLTRRSYTVGLLIPMCHLFTIVMLVCTLVTGTTFLLIIAAASLVMHWRPTTTATLTWTTLDTFQWFRSLNYLRNSCDSTQSW